MVKILGKILAIGIVFVAFFFFLLQEAQAVDCSTTNPVTINTACSFPGTETGVDVGTGETNSGSITVTTGGALTILAIQTVTSGTLTVSGGYVTIIDGGQYKAGMPLWMIDVDVDGYPATTTVYVQASAPAGGVRKNSVANPSTVDCYDSNANANPSQANYFTVNRGDGSFDYNCDTATTMAKNICSCSCASLCAVGCTLTVGTYSACGASEASGPSSCTRNDDIYGACVSCTNVGSQNQTVECK